MNKKKRILIAEDDQDTLQSILRTIISRRRTVYETRVCIDGYEALEIMRWTGIHCIVLDLHMSNLNGLQMLHEMRNDENLNSVEVIVSSAYLDESMEDQLRNLGVQHFLKKPYPMDALMKKIDDLMMDPAKKGQ